MSIVSSSYLKWECSELIKAMTSLHILHKRRIWYNVCKYVLYISWMYVDLSILWVIVCIWYFIVCPVSIVLQQRCVKILLQNAFSANTKKEHGINSVLTSSKLHFVKSWTLLVFKTFYKVFWVELLHSTFWKYTWDYTLKARIVRRVYLLFSI